MKSHAAETAGQPRVPGSRHVFSARMPDSVVGLSLPARQLTTELPQGRVVLDAAQALGAAEAWLPLLEDWLGCGLIPQLKLSDKAEPSLFNRHAVLTHPALDVDVYLPLAMLAGMPTALPETLAGWSWHSLVCDLVLDSLAFTLADVQALEVGALVVLPASFATTWGGRLDPVSGKGSAFGARLFEHRGRLCVSAAGHSASPGSRDQVTVRFTQTVEVKLPHLLGWGANKAPTLEAPQLLSPGAVMLVGSAMLKGQPLAAGQLIPVGSGFAVRLDTLLMPEAEPEVSILEPDISL
ncbi:MAG: hypothetical protein RLZZ618_825 [Pseudomonadota bacterium]|jgi:hypothetical protein